MNELLQPELFSSSMRDKVNAMEDLMRKQPQVNLEHTDFFSYGVYARSLFIPKGVILTGKIHKYENLNILLQGDISVLIDNHVERIKAPRIIVSPAGTKRIAMAHEHTVWITIHGTHEKDVDKIEEIFIAQSDKDYIEFKEQLLLGGKDG